MRGDFSGLYRAWGSVGGRYKVCRGLFCHWHARWGYVPASKKYVFSVVKLVSDVLSNWLCVVCYTWYLSSFYMFRWYFGQLSIIGHHPLFSSCSPRNTLIWAYKLGAFIIPQGYTNTFVVLSSPGSNYNCCWRLAHRLGSEAHCLGAWFDGSDLDLSAGATGVRNTCPFWMVI